MTSASPRSAADRLAAELARAERRQARIDDLLEVGMGMARDLARRRAEGESRLEWLASRFVRISRAVRMLVTIAAWIDDQILALLRGETPAPLWVGRRSCVAAAEDLALATGEAGRVCGEPIEREALSDPVERLSDPSARADRPEVEERFAFASWNDAINAICNLLDISDRSRFLECDEADDATPAAASPAPVAAGLAAPGPVATGPCSAASPGPDPRAPGASPSRGALWRSGELALE